LRTFKSIIKTGSPLKDEFQSPIKALKMNEIMINPTQTQEDHHNCDSLNKKVSFNNRSFEYPSKVIASNNSNAITPGATNTFN
jgi:hypothetical protein